jgi:hypothetical protein
LAPAGVASDALLLNVRGSGPESFSLPEVSQFGAVVLVITCTAKEHYRLELHSAQGQETAWTEGGSCGGPNINSYTTPPLDPSNLPETLNVVVPSTTGYYATVYGQSKK